MNSSPEFKYSNTSDPLTLTLLTPCEMSTLRLSETCGGRYYMFDHQQLAKKSKIRRLVEIQGKDGEWVAKSTRETEILDSNQQKQNFLRIEKNGNFSLALKEDKRSRFLVSCRRDTTQNRTFRKYIIQELTTLNVGRDRSCDVCIDSHLVSAHHLQLTFNDSRWVVRDLGSTNGTYVNQKRVRSNENICLSFGDTVYVMGVSIMVCNGFIALNNPNNSVTLSSKFSSVELPKRPENTSDNLEDESEDNYFYRSPRFMREVEDENIVVEPPPAVQKQDDMPIMMTVGPAATMGVASLFSGVMMAYNTLSNNGSITQALPMLIMSISMILGMSLWPILTRKYQNRKWLKDEQKRQIRYRDYLDRIKEQIADAGSRQAEILEENIVETSVAAKRVFEKSRNLWERGPSHSDFLNLRLGRGTLPIAAKVDFPKLSFSLENDSLLDAIGDLRREERTVHNVAIPFSLTENRIAGIVGKRAEVLDYSRHLLCQLISLHSYEEVELVFITSEDEGSDWEWAKLLPHTFDNNFKMRFFANNFEEAKTLSQHFSQILSDRVEKRQTFEDNRPDTYYVFICADRSSSLKIDIVNTLLKCPENYGFSLLFLFDALNYLPKECKSVIELAEDGKTASYYDRDDTSGNVAEIKLEGNLDRDVESDLFVAVANIHLDLESSRYVMPKTLTFLQMFEVGSVEHLNIASRWGQLSSSHSLATPIGVDQNGETMALDLHENMHGPHGLVAGMTGSGKSELIITYVLSMAVNYSPDEVAFVLIDYKGGGLARAFDNDKYRLPHLAGTITNLDGTSINRSLASIEAELKRRQAIFNNASKVSGEGTIDIYSYQKLYRQGKVEEAVPHLFIISDEFAELKQQQPEFMEQLISTARIGRSLGVHLILATQKPTGVVNDQIWSNSKLKLCLKVQDKSDSQEMIKRPEAAELVDTGRFYLSVGYNEYFAIGQSAWCGGAYIEQDEYVACRRDMRALAINNLGGVVAEASHIDRDLVVSDKREITAVVEEICSVASLQDVKARPLWLPPLEEVTYVSNIERQFGTNTLSDTRALIGTVDDPKRQRRLPLVVDITGGVIIYGAVGSGRFTFISSLLYSLIRNNKPEEFNAYVIDCGAETLSAFRDAPHVGDIIYSNEKEKILNLFQMLETEIKARKKLFAELGVDLKGYRDRTACTCPSICVVINNIGACLELYPELHDELATITRESPKYGINFVFTATNSGSIRFKLTQNIENVFTLRLTDENEFSTILGYRIKTLLPSVKGRGYCLIEGEILEFQTAYPGNDEENVFGEMQKFSQAQALKGNNYHASKIPILPEVVNADFFTDSKRDFTCSNFAVGVEKCTLREASIGWTNDAISFVLGNDSSEVRGFVLEACKLARSSGLKIAVFTPDIVAIEGLETFTNIEKFARSILSEEFDFDLCFMFDLPSTLSDLDFELSQKLKNYFSSLKNSKTSFVMCSTASEISMIKFDEWVSKSLNVGASIWVGNGITEQTCFKIGRFTMDLYEELDEMFGYVIKKQKPILVKLLSNKGSEEEQ